jgi:hypothetical protein
VARARHTAKRALLGSVDQTPLRCRSASITSAPLTSAADRMRALGRSAAPTQVLSVQPEHAVDLVRPHPQGADASDRVHRRLPFDASVAGGPDTRLGYARSIRLGASDRPPSSERLAVQRGLASLSKSCPCRGREGITQPAGHHCRPRAEAHPWHHDQPRVLLNAALEATPEPWGAIPLPGSAGDAMGEPGSPTLSVVSC